MNSIRDKVAVIGVGCTKFGDLYDSTYEDQVCDAAFQAYADAKIDPSEIDAAYIGTYLPHGQGGKAGISLADPLRLYDRPDHAGRELLRHRHRRVPQRLPRDRVRRSTTSCWWSARRS